jgi:hypothetical protein
MACTATGGGISYWTGLIQNVDLMTTCAALGQIRYQIAREREREIETMMMVM